MLELPQFIYIKAHALLSHQSHTWSTEANPKENIETMIRLGTQPMMKSSCWREKETNQDLQLEENPFNQAALLFYCQEYIGEEKLLFLNLFLMEAFL